MPKSLLNILESTLNIKGSNKVIRGSSNREDITYKRIYFKTNKEELSKLGDLLKEITINDLDVNNKILIFVSTKDKGKDLARLFNLDFIYSDLEEKDTILDNFISNRGKRALITTSIAEVGLDISSIRYTINLEPIYSLISII